MIIWVMKIFFVQFFCIFLDPNKDEGTPGEMCTAVGQSTEREPISVDKHSCAEVAESRKWNRNTENSQATPGLMLSTR